MSRVLAVFAYDISNDRDRARLARRLEQEAVRVQDSVFEAVISPTLARTITRRAEALLGPGDSLRVYLLPLGAQDRVMVAGDGAPPPVGDYHLL